METVLFSLFASFSTSLDSSFNMGYLNNSLSPKSILNSLLILANTCIAFKLCPPKLKKLSFSPIFSTSSTSCQIRATVFSVFVFFFFFFFFYYFFSKKKKNFFFFPFFFYIQYFLPNTRYCFFCFCLGFNMLFLYEILFFRLGQSISINLPILI